MSTYWLEHSSFCPLDRGLLQKSGSISFEVYTCPVCAKRFIFTSAGEIPVSESFVKPAQIYHSHKKKTVFETAAVLSMTIHNSALKKT